MQMSDCSTEQSALETATSGTFATTSSQSAATSATESQKTGVEETSMTASEVIQKFESASKSSSEANIMAVSSISSHLMQDTVSSRMKKISAEEYALAEGKNTLKTVEASEVAQKNVSETLVKKTSINKKSTADKKASTEEKKISTITSSTLESENSQEISKVSQCSKDQKVSISSKTSSSRHATTNSVTNINKSQKQSNARENGQKTAVVVHLHPGQSKRLSALLDNKEDAVENSRSLSTDIQYDNVSASICGLEISIRNISAQEIDVIFPGNQYCNINNPDLITDSLQAA